MKNALYAQPRRLQRLLPFSSLALSIGLTLASSLLLQTTSAQTRPAPSAAQAAQKHPDVLDVKVKSCGANCFDFDATLSSPYDTPQRYADAFRVTTLEGKSLGERILLHDHQNEQPFTRDLYSVKIPAGIKQVIVQGRDQQFGWGGKALTINLPGR
jgi:hypothetical protein